MLRESLLVGSQEWRRNSVANSGVYDIMQGFTSLSTRCALSAPGRSAGVASRYFSDSGEGAMLVWSRLDGVHPTRAEAAKANWKGSVIYD